MEIDTDKCLETDEPPKKKRSSSWNILCPKDSKTLFYNIIFGYEDDEVNNWISYYENDTLKAKIELIQLFFDVAGFNHINTKDFLMGEHEDIIDVDQNLNPSIVKTEGKYFLNINTNRFLILTHKLGRFIIELAKELYDKKLLHDKKLVTVFLDIWLKMTEHKLCAMFHTGIFFAIKFKTGLIEVCHEVNERGSKYSDQSGSEELISNLNICKKYIKYIDKNILHEKWNLRDPKLSQMRYQCTLEIRQWMNLFPLVYIDKEHVEYLIAGMKDQSKHVRFHTLDTFYFAFKRMDYKFNNLPQNLQVISGRLNDLDINVALLAVKVLNFVNKNCGGLPGHIDKKILNCVYSSYAKLADACGKYLVEKHKDDRPEDMLLELVTFQIQSEKNSSRSKTALLVGAIMNHVPFLQDMLSYISALRKLAEMNTDSRSEEVLLEMLEEVFQLVLFGEPTYKRHNFVCPEVSKPNARNIITELYNYLDDFRKFYDTKDLMKLLRDISYYIGESQENCDEIFKALIE